MAKTPVNDDKSSDIVTIGVWYYSTCSNSFSNTAAVPVEFNAFVIPSSTEPIAPCESIAP